MGKRVLGWSSRAVIDPDLRSKLDGVVILDSWPWARDARGLCELYGVKLLADTPHQVISLLYEDVGQHRYPYVQDVMNEVVVEGFPYRFSSYPVEPEYWQAVVKRLGLNWEIVW